MGSAWGGASSKAARSLRPMLGIGAFVWFKRFRVWGLGFGVWGLGLGLLRKLLEKTTLPWWHTCTPTAYKHTGVL